MTDGRDQIIEAGAKAAWTELARQIRINGADNLGLKVPEWDELSDDVRAQHIRGERVHYDAMLPLIVQRIERPGSMLCTCPDDQPPSNPRTRQPIDHHCDCQAVVTVAEIFGAYSLTEHARQCVHGTEFDEFYAREVGARPHDTANTEEQP